jgi:hypothetical protein
MEQQSLSEIDHALLASSSSTPQRSAAAEESPIVEHPYSPSGIETLLKASQEPLSAHRREKTIQFDLVLLITAHGITPPSALREDSHGIFELNPLTLPDMELTMMCSSEIGVTTCDYLHKFKGHLMSQIGRSLDEEQFIDLNQVQKYFRHLKTRESKKEDKQTVKEFGDAGKLYIHSEGWHIANQCVERYYIYNDAEDAQTFSDFDTLKPIQVLYQNPENTNNLSDENIYDIIQARYGVVSRSKIFEYIHENEFKNICIFDTTCGTLSRDTRQLLGILDFPESHTKYKRILNKLRYQAKRDRTALIAGKKYKNKSRKRRKSRRKI